MIHAEHRGQLVPAAGMAKTTSMSIADHSTSTAEPTFPRRGDLPPVFPQLKNGDRLTRVEFERRYAGIPLPGIELVEGIVYMPSPVRHSHHAQPHGFLIGWVTYYMSKTPYLSLGDNGTVRLDEDNEPQPDVTLLLPAWSGGAARVDEDDYVSGSPELVCEVAASSVSIDLHAKMNAYRRNGVKEYLVWRVEDAAVNWFQLVEGRYEPMQPDERGRLRSKIFPGLSLDVAALLAGDLAKVFAAVDEGIATHEHKAFVAKLNEPAAEHGAHAGPAT